MTRSNSDSLWFTRYRRLLILPVLLLAGLPLAVRAQQETGTIAGTVTDPTGAVIPKAQITVTQEETNAKVTTTSDGSGLYSVPALSVGHYTLVVSMQGFQTYRKTGITLDAGQTVPANVQLLLGSSTQTVTVKADALQIQTLTNEVSTLISGQQVLNIATDGRNITSLTTLGTGVSWNGPAFNGVTAQNSAATISFNGLRPDHNNFLVDGGEAYDRGSGGKLDVLPSPDAIGEFQILSSNYSPDYGIASGGTVMVELKQGTRQLHGTLWEFDRNDTFDAIPYFTKLAGAPYQIPELRLNIFGGNISGPVLIPHIYNPRKEKTFFFFNEEFRRYIAGVTPTLTTTVPSNDFPTTSATTGGFNYTPFNCPSTGCTAPIVPNVPGNTAYTGTLVADGLTPGSPFPLVAGSTNTYAIPANLMDTNAVLFMGTGAIPHPNVGTDEYTASPKQPTYVREEVVRIDHYFNDKFHLMGSWIHDAMSQTIIPTQWSGDSYDTVGDVFVNPTWSSAVRLTQQISPTVVNETGLFVNGNTINVSPYSPLGPSGYVEPNGWNAGSFFTGNNADNRLPQLAFGAPLNTTWSLIYWPWHNSYLDYQIRDDLTFTKGRHTFKFGTGLMREDKNQQLQADTEGDYGFSNNEYSDDSYVNFLLGLSASYDQLQQERTDHWISDNYEGYGTDTWEVLPRLTLELGLRYDAIPHTYEKFNQVSNFTPTAFNPLGVSDATMFNNSGTLCAGAVGGCATSAPYLQSAEGENFYLNGIQLAGSGGYPRGLVQNDWFTWQPRIGFDLDLFGNGKAVLRGGMGVFYERVQGNDIYNVDTTPPFAYQPSVSNVFFSSPATSILNGATATVPLAPASLTRMGNQTSNYYPNPATTQYSLGIQYQVSPAVVAEVMYVGSSAWDQDDKRETNDLLESNMAYRQAVATGCSGAWTPVTQGGVTYSSCPSANSNPNLDRQYLGFSNIVLEENANNANYNSLQMMLRTQSYHGVSAQLSYTWSHEIDIESADLTTASEAGTSFVSDPYNLKYDRGSGLFDRRNIFNVNVIYVLPFFNNEKHSLEQALLGGWTFADVTVMESGSPQNIYYNGPDVLGLGGNATSRMSFVNPGHVSFPHQRTKWFNTADFTSPVAPWNGGANNGFGDAGKDTIVQPGLFNFNMSLYKDFSLTNSGRVKFELRIETYNTFNHTEWNSLDTGSTDSTYGQITSTYDPRVFQFGGKVMF